MRHVLIAVTAAVLLASCSPSTPAAAPVDAAQPISAPGDTMNPPGDTMNPPGNTMNPPGDTAMPADTSVGPLISPDAPQPTGDAPPADAIRSVRPAAYAIATTALTLAADNRLSANSSAYIYGYTMLAGLRAYAQAPRGQRDAAAAVAAATAGTALFQYSAMGEREWRALALSYPLINDAVRTNAQAIGTQTAEQAKVGYFDAITAEPELPVETDWDWEPTGVIRAPFEQPRWRTMTPITSAASCDIPAPNLPEIDKQMRELNASYTPQTAADPIVTRWLAGPGSATPSGMWLQIAASAARANQLNSEDAMRVLAATAIAGYDASILTWREKHEHHLARPETMWKRAGAPKEMIRETPPHPSYPSGHSTFSGAGARVITELIGDSPVVLTLPADNGIPAETIRYPDATTAMKEASLSRVKAGFHYPADGIAGETLGACAADAAIDFVTKELA